MKYTANQIQKCDVCEAPYRKPLTQGWTITEYKVNGRQLAMIHRPQCPLGRREQAKIDGEVGK